MSLYVDFEIIKMVLSKNFTPTSDLCLLGSTGNVAPLRAYSVGLSFVRLSGRVRSAHSA